MTTNLSFDQIKDMLDTADQKDRNIRIKYQIQSYVKFSDVVIQNDKEQLATSVFHKPEAEPYILPYTSDHSRHVHRNIPYAALLRAARICSNMHDFTIERIRIDMSLLLNDYPSAFITKHLRRFFDQYNAQSVLKQLNEQDYSKLHQKLVHQPTRREKQRGCFTAARVTDEKKSMESTHPVCFISVRKWTPYHLQIHLSGLAGKILLSSRIYSGSFQTEIFHQEWSDTRTMFCAQEAGQRNVAEDGQYTCNKDWTMNVKKAKLKLIRQYYSLKTLCIYKCISYCCEKRH